VTVLVAFGQGVEKFKAWIHRTGKSKALLNATKDNCPIQIPALLSLLHSCGRPDAFLSGKQELGSVSRHLNTPLFERPSVRIQQLSRSIRQFTGMNRRPTLFLRNFKNEFLRK